MPDSFHGPFNESLRNCSANNELTGSKESSATNILRQIISQAKKHPHLIPLYVFIGAGGTRAALYLLSLELFNPDISWNRKNNPESWNKLGPKDQYKFYLANVDSRKLKKKGPSFYMK
uniref:cytochrome c oxidase subunit NDUFA4-like n=1 Tax=Callithrix jacchus TaxID=9483 RepID=UPI0023DCFC0A|nr:cytochrome c oxidase subunit NDUFA4-like [Callithrix jacchus]